MSSKAKGRVDKETKTEVRGFERITKGRRYDYSTIQGYTRHLTEFFQIWLRGTEGDFRTIPSYRDFKHWGLFYSCYPWP